MNPRERLLAILTGNRVDRVPLDLKKLGGINSQITSRRKLEEIEDPGYKEIATRVYDKTVNPIKVPSFVNRYLVTPPKFIETREGREKGELVLNKEIDTPKGLLKAKVKRNEESKTTWHVKYPVESLEDIEKIRSIPWSCPEGLSPPENDIISQSSDKEIVKTSISSPFVCVAGMMKYEYFLKLCATELELIKELTELCAERILATLDVLFENDVIEYVWMGGCEWLTPPMGSPKLYEELVQKWERPIIERIHEGGAFCHIHCHGNVRSTLRKMVERRGDFTEPVEPPPDGDVPFEEAKDIVDGEMVLGGNIEIRILQNGDERKVEEAVKAAFEGGKEAMILTPTESPISRMDPQMVANYHRLIDVWEELSPF